MVARHCQSVFSMSRLFSISQDTVEGEVSIPKEKMGRPFFRGVVEDIMKACSSLSLATRRTENREYRIAEIKKLLFGHKVAVYVLESALAAEKDETGKEYDIYRGVEESDGDWIRDMSAQESSV